MSWTRNKGKPYIRKANGSEKAATLRDAIRLAFYQSSYGLRGFYVMLQRRTGPEVMAVGRVRQDIVRSLCGVRRPSEFNAWANRMKRMAQK